MMSVFGLTDAHVVLSCLISISSFLGIDYYFTASFFVAIVSYFTSALEASDKFSSYY